MAGLFSKKSKKDKEDSSSTNSSTNARYPSASNGVSRSQSANPQSPTPQQQQQQQQHPNGLSSKSSLHLKHQSSLQPLNYQSNSNSNSNSNINIHSATSLSTHQSAFTTNNGPWASGVIMSTDPFPRFAHTASFVTTGVDIYVFGGIVKGLAQKDVHVIDPQSLHCQLLPVSGDCPPATSGHTAVTLGQYIMCFGGKDAKGKTSDALHVLHTGRKEWNRPLIHTLLPAPRHSHAACVIGTIMYIIGGRFSGYYMNDIAAFDMKTLNGKHPFWSKLEPKSDLPPARAGHCAAAYDGKVYIFGGADDKYYYNDIWCYDPQTNQWEAIPAYGNLPTSRQGHTVCVIDDAMYIHGGMNFEDQLLGDLCAFKFSERRWVTFPNMMETASPRTEHAMCNVGDRIYILGGQLDQNTIEDAGSLVYALDTAKIRWNGASTVDSQRSAYDNESMNRLEGGNGPEERNSPYNQLSPTPDSARYQRALDETIHPHDLRRATYQQQGQQQQNYQDHQEQYGNYPEHQKQQQQQQQQQQKQQQQHQHQHLNQQQHQQDMYSASGEASGSRTGLGITENSRAIGNSSDSGKASPMPPYSNHGAMDETTHVARRRTMGKPMGFSIQDFEPRRTGGALSADDGRRPALLDNEMVDNAVGNRDQMRSGNVPMQRQVSSTFGSHNNTESEERSYSQQHQQGERSHRLNNGGGNSNNNNVASRPNPALQHQLSYLDLSRQGSSSTNNTITDSLNHNGSLVESINRGSYTSITNLQSNGRTSADASLRIPLRVTNPDNEGRDLRAQGDVEGGAIQQSTARHGPSSSPAPSSKAPKDSKEMKDLKQREQWLLAEVSMARKKMGERPLSMAIMALEDELDACEVDSEKYRIMQALLNVKAELERSKSTIATQAQIASNKVREAERIRTSALQETVYLKAKVDALQTGEISALVATETARATELERRLTSALAQLDQYESQFVQYETILENERESRVEAESRGKEASLRAEESQLAHKRALNDLTTLHERATVAEASLLETVAKSATSEAGLSGYQQQSAALFSQISSLKTTVDQQKKSLEKAKMAYAVANNRAEHADSLWIRSREEMDQIQLEVSGIRADLDRSQRESDHWRAKAGEAELLWQKSKKENEAMRVLLEEDMDASYSSPISKERKHDSIVAITSASRVAELEHELSTLRQLVRDSQDAAAHANKDLSDTMVCISQLEQSSMTARAEAAAAQRKLNEARDKMSLMQTQLIHKEEAVEEMVREQENNEVQLDLLRSVMKEHGINADDLILEALNQNVDGKTPSTSYAASPMKMKIQEAESRAYEAENQLDELIAIKRGQEERIQQLEADYQTALHYVQGTESTLQRLRDESIAANDECDMLRANLKELELVHANCSSRRGNNNSSSGESTSELKGELVDLQRQLHAAQERTYELEDQMESLSTQLHNTESRVDVSEIEINSWKAKHQEQKKRGASQTDQFQSKVEELERSLIETRYRLDRTFEDLEQAHELNKVTGQELEDALDALKKSRQAGDDRRTPNGRNSNNTRRQEELEAAVDNAQRTIQSLQQTNQSLEVQLRASENKISLLLDNFHSAPDSVRSSVASMSGLHGLSVPSSPPMMASSGILTGRSHLNSPPVLISARSMSPATPSTKMSNNNGGRSSGGGSGSGGQALTNSQKLEEYEKLIDEMANARRQYDE